MNNKHLLYLAATVAFAASTSVYAHQTMPSRTPASYSSKPAVHMVSNQRSDDRHADSRSRHDSRDSRDHRDNDRGRGNDRGRDNDGYRHADNRGHDRGGWGKPSWGRDDDLELSKVKRNDPEATFWKDLGRDPWGNNSGWKQIGTIDGHSVWKITSDGVTYYKVYDNNADQKFWNSQKGNKDDQTLWRLREDDGGRGVLVLRDNDRGITLYKVSDGKNRDNPVIGNNGFKPVNWNKVDVENGKGHGKPGNGHGNGHGHGHHPPRPPVSAC